MTVLVGSPKVREQIKALQDAMIAMPPGFNTVEDMELTHMFAPGLYIRQIMVPAGTLIVGKIHKHAHANNISLGKCKVVTEFDSYEIHAPYSFVSEPGTKRAVLALSDLMWTTYHLNPSNTQDLAVLEADIIAPDYLSLGAS